MFTRVIIDHGHRFDEITPGYKGKALSGSDFHGLFL